MKREIKIEATRMTIEWQLSDARRTNDYRRF